MVAPTMFVFPSYFVPTKWATSISSWGEQDDGISVSSPISKTAWREEISILTMANSPFLSDGLPMICVTSPLISR